jgi:hypothetical protein
VQNTQIFTLAYKKGLQRYRYKKEQALNIVFRACIKKAATYSPTFAVPSALRGLTSLFGMGRGGTPSLKPPLLFSETLRHYASVSLYFFLFFYDSGRNSNTKFISKNDLVAGLFFL